jgi:hypothetical protein
MPSADSLDDARQYLRELAAACLEAAESSNPQVTALALALVHKQGVRPRRGGETYSLICHCGKEIEISARAPHRCCDCGRGLEIQWQA